MEETPFESRLIGACRIELVVGNIVEQQTDAIVNAANTQLSGGGGVDGAIHRAAGKALMEECLALPADEQGRRCPTGEVRVTGAGKLPARHVIHAVGPFFNARYADKADRQLREVHENSLTAAVRHGCHSVVVPAISTGAYRFPVDRAATIAVLSVAEFLRRNQTPEVVRFVLFTQGHFNVFRTALEQLTATERDYDRSSEGNSTCS
jgi:O-acetyl-ADP-ribose deacetylase (regulator of RNase III)